MIAVDTNILVYAHREDSEWHAPAERSVRQLAEGRGAWTIPWPCIHEFLAITTHPRIFQTPTPLPAALFLAHEVRELWTADCDFSMFPALRVRNPLIA